MPPVLHADTQTAANAVWRAPLAAEAPAKRPPAHRCRASDVLYLGLAGPGWRDYDLEARKRGRRRRSNVSLEYDFC